MLKSQVKFSICWDPDEVYSNDNEEMSLLVRLEQACKNTDSFFYVVIYAFDRRCDPVKVCHLVPNL